MRQQNWFDDEEDKWQELRGKVSQDEIPDRSDKRKFRFNFWNKDTSSFDEPSKEATEKLDVNIKLTIPNFKNIISKYLVSLLKKKRVLVLASLLLVVAIGVVVKTSLLNDKDTDATVAGTSNSTSKPEALPREKPSFSILYPGGKNEGSVGEIVRISPPGNEPVYTYIDELSGVQLNVSQQLIPERFKSSPDAEVEKLAKDFQQDKVIQVDSIKIYHGQSESGVQSLLFIKGNLLITIRSSQPLEDDTWAAYISALHS